MFISIPITVSKEEDESKIIRLRNKLMLAKSNIETQIDNTSMNLWENITRKYELDYHLKRYLQKNNIFNLQIPASNAFFKALELFNYIKIKDDDVLFDNASLPGDFIRTFQYLCKNKWYANSLIDSSFAVEDRYNMLKSYPNNWITNILNIDGNILNVNNLLSIQSLLKNKNITIYTSDLGFKINDYYKEEEEHFWGNFGQILLGLMVLQKGGKFIIKMFNCFTKETHLLINILSKQFETLIMCKPITSKADNSECYLIGTNYLGISKYLEDILLTSLYYQTICIDLQHFYFYNSILTNYIINILTNNQCKKINQDIEMFKNKYILNLNKNVRNWLLKNIKK